MTDIGRERGKEGENGVLMDFYAACPLPALDDVEAWCARHPAHALAIRAQADDLRSQAVAAILSGRVLDDRPERLGAIVKKKAAECAAIFCRKPGT